MDVGSKVQWKWMGTIIVGIVKEVHFKPISKTIKGKVIKRNGSPEKPAYLVQSEAGNLALKLQTELQPYNIGKTKFPKPKMFS